MNLIKFNVNLLQLNPVYAKDKETKERTKDLKGYMLSYVELHTDNEFRKYGVAANIYASLDVLSQKEAEELNFLDPLVLTYSMASSVSNQNRIVSIEKNTGKLENKVELFY